MSLTIAIQFLTGRAHLHPWQSHHSEGRVEWPPSPWRLLRAVVAVAGRGLTSLPHSDELRLNPATDLAPAGVATRHARGVLKRSPAACSSALADVDGDEIPLSRLAALLSRLSATPWIWVPRTSGGHTRQYFPIHKAGIVKNTGAAVFDTFAAISKNQPLLFHWPQIDKLDEQQQLDLQFILSRMTYFGRAESWCRVQAHTLEPSQIPGVIIGGAGQTHWPCVCIEDGPNPEGTEYRDYTLERRLAPARDLDEQAIRLLPRTRTSDGEVRKAEAVELFKKVLESEVLKSGPSDRLLLRCLLRESGQDIKDGLDRPIGARWVHYAVPRAIFEVPRPKPQSRSRRRELVNLVRYALNTATVGRPVLPPVTDTLLVANRFRNAVMALCQEPSPMLSGHEADGAPCEANKHAYWWPVDEDNDGFIDHVMVWAPGGFEIGDADALRRLTRLKQRGGRPDLLVTPTFIGLDRAYRPWQLDPSRTTDGCWTTTFASSTPYFCPVHLSHGKRSGGRVRPLVPELLRSLRAQNVISEDDEINRIEEIVFDYAPAELATTVDGLRAARLHEPVPPRQYFPVVEPPTKYPPLPRLDGPPGRRYRGACVKDPDAGYPFGLSIGLLADDGRRFIRAMSFGRHRGPYQVKGYGRMFIVHFRAARPPRPFAIGDQCHFGLGLFTPAVTDGAPV